MAVVYSTFTLLVGGADAVRRLKLYIAASLDGYIAGPNGVIDWPNAGGELAEFGLDRARCSH